MQNDDMRNGATHNGDAADPQASEPLQERKQKAKAVMAA